jgi:hypothetical protein
MGDDGGPAAAAAQSSFPGDGRRGGGAPAARRSEMRLQVLAAKSIFQTRGFIISFIYPAAPPPHPTLHPNPGEMQWP